MASAIAERLMTAEEFAETTDPPGMRTELVRGRIVVTPIKYTVEGMYIADIAAAVGRFVQLHDLGMVCVSSGYILGRRPDTVRGPDVSFISRERLSERPAPLEGWYEGAPSLVVEVIRRIETRAEVADKVAQYFAAGAERVWKVRPRQRTVTVLFRGAPAVKRRVGEVLNSADAGFAVDGFVLGVGAILRVG